ncbi:MAG: quinone-dependent dihydroorotate dehydrogenase [Hyphomicrobiales bacterium]|nr:quinone-dependent dihydroorotate dehydrogenase [Hyphomicrobiales bacterium]
MSGLVNLLARPLLFAMDAEKAHGATIKALKILPVPRAAAPDPSLAVEAFGLHFPAPLGMAPGFDKGGEVPDALLRLGFGHVEIGTITPLPQPGNPKPRVFRLAEDLAVINRLGFNSEGHAVAHARLAARANRGGIIGINVGANKDSSDRSGDYVTGIKAFADVASYFTINISSPNTPGLRDLQQAAALDDLLARVVEARDAMTARHGRKPLLLKIAPDLTAGDLDDVVRVARVRAVDGMIVVNTTFERPPTLRSPDARQSGGLSGRPLFGLSTKMLAAAYLRVEGQFPLIGVGGIDGPETAFAKIEAGASLLQIYSVLVFEGPGLIGEIHRGLARMLRESGRPLDQIVGSRAAHFAAGF